MENNCIKDYILSMMQRENLLSLLLSQEQDMNYTQFICFLITLVYPRHTTIYHRQTLWENFMPFSNLVGGGILFSKTILSLKIKKKYYDPDNWELMDQP